MQRRRRHNEEAMTEAEIDLERWMEGETREVEVVRPFSKDGVKENEERVKNGKWCGGRGEQNDSF